MSTQNQNHQASLLKGLPILIVDGDPLSAKFLRVLLTGEGCSVQVACSAEEALRNLRLFQPRCILLELVLPLMSGLLLAELIRANPLTHDIKIVAVTAFNGHETVRMAHEAGCVAYFHKPVDPVDFPKQLCKHLEEK